MNDSERAAEFVREWNDAVNYERSHGDQSIIKFAGASKAGRIRLGWPMVAAVFGAAYGLLFGREDRYIAMVVYALLCPGLVIAGQYALLVVRIAARVGITGVDAIDRLLWRVPSWTIMGAMVGALLGAWAAEFDSGFMQGVVLIAPVGAFIAGLSRFLIVRRRARTTS